MKYLHFKSQSLSLLWAEQVVAGYFKDPSQRRGWLAAGAIIPEAEGGSSQGPSELLGAHWQHSGPTHGSSGVKCGLPRIFPALLSVIQYF